MKACERIIICGSKGGPLPRARLGLAAYPLGRGRRDTLDYLGQEKMRSHAHKYSGSS